MSFCRWAHSNGDSYSPRLPEDFRLAFAGRRMSLFGAAACSLDGGVLSFSFATLPPSLFALETLYESWVENILFWLPGVVLGLPTFPFHIILDFVLKQREFLGYSVYIITRKRGRAGALAWRDYSMACSDRRVAHSLADYSRFPHFKRIKNG